MWIEGVFRCWLVVDWKSPVLVKSRLATIWSTCLNSGETWTGEFIFGRENTCFLVGGDLKVPWLLTRGIREGGLAVKREEFLWQLVILSTSSFVMLWW